jgi:hypothetical protein
MSLSFFLTKLWIYFLSSKARVMSLGLLVSRKCEYYNHRTSELSHPNPSNTAARIVMVASVERLHLVLEDNWAGLRGNTELP